MKAVLYLVVLIGAIAFVASRPHIHRKPVRPGPGHGHVFDGRTGYEHDIRVRSQGTPRTFGLHSPGLLGKSGLQGGHVSTGEGFIRPRGESHRPHSRSGHLHNHNARAAAAAGYNANF